MSSVQEMSSFSTLYSFLYTLIVIAICYNDYNMQLFYCQAITPQCSISRRGMCMDDPHRRVVTVSTS